MVSVTMRQLLTACMALLPLAVGGQAPRAASAPPARPPGATVPLPPFAEFELGNGLRVLVVSREQEAMLSMRLSVLAGSLYDPAGESGMAELLAGVLSTGSLRATAGPDFLTVEASVPSADRELGFSRMADALLRPTFALEAVEGVRAQTLSALARARGRADAIAGRLFARAVYGDHPYGRRPDDASVRAITREDLVEFHSARLRPTQALLVLAGAIDSAEAFRLAEQSFGAWSGRGAAPPLARPAPQRARTAIVLVHLPGAVQSRIVVGNTTWMPTDTRGYALVVANHLLGGANDARLPRMLRAERGWATEVSSALSRVRGIGTFTATAEAPTAVTDSVLVEMLRQIRRIGSEPMPAGEFGGQRQALLGRFARQVETAEGGAAEVAEARLLGLAADYVQTYRQRVAAVTPEQVQAAARSGMRPDAAVVVVVGDGPALHERLARIAPVQVVDVDGVPIGEGGAVASAKPVSMNRQLLQAGTDSFTVLVQGQPFGFQFMALTRTLDGWEYLERSSLGPIIQQTTTVRFSPMLAMWSTEQRGRFQGNELRLDVRYDAGMAHGEGLTPGNGGMRSVRYADVTVPEGTIDDNMLVGLLPYFTWSLGATVPVSVFASGRGVVESRTFRVVTEEALTIPLGTFQAYRIAYEGGEAPGTYWVEVTAPHRVLKFGPQGVPLEFVRAR